MKRWFAVLSLTTMLLPLSVVAWEKIPPATLQDATEFYYFNGSEDACWNHIANSSVYLEEGAFLETCQGALPIEPGEGNGALKLRSQTPSGFWNVLLRVEFGHPANYMHYGGKDGSLAFRLRWAEGSEGFGIGLIPSKAKSPLRITDYATPSPDWQTIYVPIADFVAHDPTADLTRITAIQLVSLGTHPGESLIYIAKLSVTPRNLYTEMVKVNQLGYLPDSPKRFILSYEPGGIGEINPTSLTFNVLDNCTGERVFEGGVLIQDEAPVVHWDTWDKSGDIVYHGDFSQIATPGEYVIEIPQLGQYSYPFHIREDVYTNAFRDVLRFFYYARSGEKIIEPYAEGYTRRAYFVDDANAPYNYQSGTRDVRGGWFDAGDPHKDIHAQVQPLWFLLETLDDFRSKVGPGTLNIPEADGVHSDLIFLIKYGLDWMLKMWNEDGGVHFFVDYAPGGFKETRGSVSGVSSYATATTAAIFAKAHRSLQGAPELSEYADRLLHKAVQCWEWLENHSENVDAKLPDGSTYGYAKNNVQDQAQRMLAAIELYITTGDMLYHNYFQSHYQGVHGYKNADWEGIVSQMRNATLSLGYMDYIACTREGVDAAIRDELKAAYIKQADWIVDKIERVPYRPGVVASNNMYWGSNGVLAGNVYALLRVSEWTSKSKYRNAALANIHWICGRNPVSYTMISGHGDKPTDFYSFYWTDISHQPPGYLTGGINEFASTDYIKIPWKRYAAVHIAPTQEPWLGWNAQLGYALGYFSTPILTFAPETRR